MPSPNYPPFFLIAATTVPVLVLCKVSSPSSDRQAVGRECLSEVPFEAPFRNLLMETLSGLGFAKEDVHEAEGKLYTRAVKHCTGLLRLSNLLRSGPDF